jgi:Ca2+-binding RTX toxin-like protein
MLVLATTLVAGMTFAGSPASARGGRPTCFGKRATIVGTDERDTLRGTPGRDVIVGLGARDDINGLGGDDLLCGKGDGYHSDQNDFGDVLRGGAGDDKLDSDHGDDTEYGGRGDDYLYSGGGSEATYGDYLVGGPGDDRLVGGPVGDGFAPGAGNDTVVGGKGEDFNEDVLDLSSASNGVRVSVGSHTTSGQGKDHFRGIERFVGSDHDDVFVGDGHSNTVSGGKGDDVLRGRGGNDYLDGDRRGSDDENVGGGNDLLIGGTGSDGLGSGAGRDKLMGGSGKDGFYFYGDGKKRVIAGHQAHQSLQFFFGPVHADIATGKARVDGDTHGLDRVFRDHGHLRLGRERRAARRQAQQLAARLPQLVQFPARRSGRRRDPRPAYRVSTAASASCSSAGTR